LVVDDEPQIRRALSLHLGVRGYEVFEADSGERAMQVAATEHPDVVLLDLGLPGMDGVLVIQALRGWTSMPIIVLTVRDDERSKVQALDAGADDYVTKPFGMAELLARARVLRRTPGRRVCRRGDDVVVPPRSRRPSCICCRSAQWWRRRPRDPVDPTEWAIVEYLVRYPVGW
jgi:two-component system KDP operon response regulator KdpE